MFQRLINPSKSNSFFIFGARGTGKSTYILNQFEAQQKEQFHHINLLESIPYTRYGKNPDQMIEDLSNPKQRNKIIVIDEIQKLPKLLDTVHHLIEKNKTRFILTGSSARKLKRGSANLLAGRAFQYYMHPLTHIELEDSFNLQQVLQYGSLPKIFSISENDKIDFLQTYARTYLKEEILEEQIVRNGFAFQNFLEISAQENSNALNYSKIAKDLDVDYKTIQNYFQILEDTLVGFFLPAFHRSPRKSVKLQPKFYLFDLGVKRALEGSLSQSINPSTSAYGKAFEHFIICETFRLNSYYKLDYRTSHYQTYSGGEIDLILHRGREVIAVEIKSGTLVDRPEVKKLAAIANPLRPSKMFYVSNDPVDVKIEGVSCLHWRDFFKKFKNGF